MCLLPLTLDLMTMDSISNFQSKVYIIWIKIFTIKKSRNYFSFVPCLLHVTILGSGISKSGKTWKMISTISWCFYWFAVLTVVWKIWYTSDTSYIMQTIIAYQHLPPTKFLLTFVGLYSPDNDQTILLNIENKIGNA